MSKEGPSHNSNIVQNEILFIYTRSNCFIILGWSNLSWINVYLQACFI